MRTADAVGLGLAVVLGLMVGGCASTPDAPATFVAPRRPVATYSIVARDPVTGEMGVAVQSHWFSVGSVVPWAEAGIGAVATQSLVDPSYGSLGIELMRYGRTAPEALRALLAGDDGRDVRQVAMIDARGRIASHTGERCIAEAGHVVDERWQFAAQANLMRGDTVWEAMATAYRETRGDLAERLMSSLEAAERAGGDIRGRQSAALLIVAPEASDRPWIDRRFDLRVEDHPDPLEELRRLIGIQRAYQHMNAGDLALEAGDFEGALREYAAAERQAPRIVEIKFWHAVTLVTCKRTREALPMFREVFRDEPVWAELVPRLVEPGLLPVDEETLGQILDQAK